MYEYIGSLHIHSRFSDGSASIPEIAYEAEKAGMDFICITDHQTLEGKEQGLDGWYGKTLVIIGAELNRKRNHYLAFNLKELVEDTSDNPQQTISQVKNQGGIGFLAHPCEKGSPLIMQGQSFPWTDWQVEGFDGIELWNFCSQWREQACSRLKLFYWYFFNRSAPLSSGAPEELLQKWDEWTQKRRISAIGGTDAHAFPLQYGPLRGIFLPYPYLFRTINTHILLSQKMQAESALAQAQVLKALQKGSAFIANNAVSPAQGFVFSAFNRNREVGMGEEINHDSALSLKISSPNPRSRIRIIKNGKLVYTTNKSSLIFKVLKPGVFRVEVYYRPRVGRPRPWIYSNPIYVR
ncbi:MAG: CehA/McbA family metallohydrolase [Dethiobacteria bacterium]|jgi:hypothetical protein|nr:CehA/McbA family metallohydrolase [Bacillota bacterium]